MDAQKRNGTKSFHTTASQQSFHNIISPLLLISYYDVYAHTTSGIAHCAPTYWFLLSFPPEEWKKKKKKVFPSWAHCVSAYAPLWLTDLKKRKKNFWGCCCVSSLFFGSLSIYFSLIIIKLHFASIRTWQLKKKIHFFLFYFLSLSLLKRIQFHPHPDAFSSFLTSKLNCDPIWFGWCI